MGYLCLRHRDGGARVTEWAWSREEAPEEEFQGWAAALYDAMVCAPGDHPCAEEVRRSGQLGLGSGSGLG